MMEYIPYEYNGRTCLIDRYVLLDEIFCDESEYSIYDLNIHPSVKYRIEELTKNGYAGFEIFSELSPHYMNVLGGQRDFKGKKIYLYTELFSPKACKIILQFIVEKNTKLWVNGECLSIHQYDCLNAFYVTADLRKGINVFLIEQYSLREGALFSIQIRNYMFEMS